VLCQWHILVLRGVQTVKEYAVIYAGRSLSLRHPKYKAKACFSTLEDVIMSIYKVLSVHRTLNLFVNSILLAFLEFLYYYYLEFEDGLSLSECFSVEISDRPPRLSLFCIDVLYNC
jgi:hypothetical protein